jgi:hypothetical protein
MAGHDETPEKLSRIDRSSYHEAQPIRHGPGDAETGHGSSAKKRRYEEAKPKNIFGSSFLRFFVLTVGAFSRIGTVFTASPPR